ncbi:phage tail tape measure protein [Pseudomonas frederiksbergensis]|uniref:phage tail tape measure protein n=1 Tax=Pseudomonas frederiksbergensis TaxID=104087 RepID=UPI0028630ED1|nr:phage tail tape measure protein [Pseudomonas frederiksbergensis]MDR7109188.1 lambda family phage tail tape measure protein [Pseudomonas frederiksbergensis]
MNIAELGIKVDSADAAHAATDLDKLTKSGERAEQSAVGLMKEMEALEKSLSKGATTTQELAKQRDSLAKLTQTGAYGEAEFTKITAQLDKQQLALAKSTLDEQKALNSLLGAIDPAKAAMSKLDTQVEQLGKHLDAGRISQDQYNSALNKIDKDYAKLEKTATGFDKLKLGTRQAQENVVQLGNALSSGDWGSGVRAVAQLGAGAGSAAIGFAAVAAPIALAAAGIAALTNAYYQGTKETSEYNKALTLTGNFAGTSAGQLSEMARQVSATVGTTGAAADVLATLAGSGKLASGSFVEIAEAALAMEKATGKSVDATVAEFVKIADDPVAAAKSLNEQYHFLTASVYSQIVALKEQGDEIGATKLLSDTYADTIQSRSGQIISNLSLWEKAWKGVASETQKTLDAFKDIGRAEESAKRIVELTQSVAFARSALAADPDDIDAKKKLQNSQQELEFLTKQRDTQAAIASAAGLYQQTQDKAQDAQRRVKALSDSNLTNEEKRNKLIKEYLRDVEAIRKATPNDPSVQADVVTKNIQNIKDKNKDPAAVAGSVDLTGFNSAKNALAETLAYYKNAEKELEASQRAGVISQASFTEQRVGLLQQQATEVAESYQSEIDALEAAKTKKGTTAAQVIQIDQKISDARSAMVKAQQDSDSELAIIATNEEGRLRKQTLAVSTYTSALQQQVETLRQQGLRAASGLGQGDRQRGLTEQQNGIDDKANAQRIDLANQYGDGSRGMSLDEYNAKLKAVAQSQQDLRNVVVANYDDMTSAQGSWTAGASSAWENYLESTRDVAGQTKSLFTNAFSSMEDAITQFAMTGKLSFGDFAKSVLADMAKIALRQGSSAALSGLFGLATSAASTYFGGSSSTSLGASQAGYSSTYFPQAKGGAWSGGVQMFADGGAFTNSIVSKPTAFGMANGNLGIAGEAGPEAIVPLARDSQGRLGVRGGANSSTVNVSVTVDASDGGGASPDPARLAEAIKVVCRQEIATARRNGGQLT